MTEYCSMNRKYKKEEEKKPIPNPNLKKNTISLMLMLNPSTPAYSVQDRSSIHKLSRLIICLSGKLRTLKHKAAVHLHTLIIPTCRINISIT